MISIILSVYNGEAFLQQCLDSILVQTYKNFELIIINDGSIDNSHEIICKNYSKFFGLTYIMQENRGLAYCRNKGIALAKGDYITFIDADDLIAPNMLEVLYHYTLKYKTDVVYAELISFPEKKNPVLRPVEVKKFEILDSYEAVKDYFNRKRGNVCGGLFASELLRKTKFPSGLIYEDNAVKIKALLLANRVIYVKAKLYYYRHRHNSITTAKVSSRNMDIIRIGKWQKDLLKKHNMNMFRFVKKEYYLMYSDLLYRIVRSETFYQDKNAFQSLNKIPFSYILELIVWRLVYYPQDTKIALKLLAFKLFGSNKDESIV